MFHKCFTNVSRRQNVSRETISSASRRPRAPSCLRPRFLRPARGSPYNIKALLNLIF